jgi:uncharacterized repeat protein (TIGR01451 family)
MRRKKIWIFTALIFCFGFSHAQVWKSLGEGIPTAPSAITSTGKLIATAHIASPLSTTAYREYTIRIWNGIYWQDLPTITVSQRGAITSLQFYGNALYIAGKWDTANNLDSSAHIIRWKNRQYESIPSLTRDLQSFDFVRGMTTTSNKLLVYGAFYHTSANYGANLVAYNGQESVSISGSFGDGIDGNITAINITEDNAIVIGGRFGKVDGTSADLLAYFSDDSWTRITNNTILPQIITSNKSAIYFYGTELSGAKPGFYMLNNGTIDTLKNNLSAIDKVYDFMQLDGVLYASGLFQLDDTDTECRIIKWESGKWVPLENGNLLGVTNLLAYDDALIATGFFTNFPALQLPLSHIGKYVENAGIATGQIFFDKDKNCEFDKRDEQLDNMAIRISPTGEIIKPRADGKFFALLEAGSYEFTVLLAKNWFTSDACGGRSIKATISKGQLNDSLNFSMLQEVGKRDLRVRLSSYTGRSALNNTANNYIISYANVGSADIGKTELVLKFDEKFTNLSAKPAPDRIEGDSAVWVIENLYSGEQRNVAVALTIATTNNSVELEANIGLQEEEEDKEDNKYKLSQVLEEGEYEFKKYVLPSSGGDTATISPDEQKIGYQISFKNYGTDTVRNVYVIDTIGLNHSMSYIQEVSSSHPYQTNIYPGIPGSDIGIIVYTFHNIDLHPNPQKYSDKATSFGYIAFDIGLNNGLVDGTLLSNKAYVVFDYLDAEETNRVWALVDASKVDVAEITLERIMVYPNPAHSVLNVNLPIGSTDFEYSITSVTGQVLSSGGSNVSQINISQLNAGLHVLRLEIEGKLYYSKFIKN